VRVTALHLADNAIKLPQTVAAVGAALQCCPALTRLDLSFNNVGRKGAAALTEALEGCPLLQNLRLRSIGVDDAAAAALVEALADHPAMLVLDLSQNELGAAGRGNKRLTPEALTNALQVWTRMCWLLLATFLIFFSRTFSRPTARSSGCCSAGTRCAAPRP
jgi:Ran GTPase-activating protein (RanGAP) involved in mRNA processing and transport